MSAENVEIVRSGFERFRATHDFDPEIIDPEFVWDMSTFRGWPEQRVYEGIEGARRFMRDWLDAWEDWEFEIQALEDAGDNVVAVVRQRGRARATGARVDMTFGQVFTLREGKQVRMQMYDDPAEAREAAGLGS